MIKKANPLQSLIKRSSRAIVALLAISSMSALQAAGFRFHEDRTFHGEVSVNARGEITLLTTGDDPQLIFSWEGEPAPADHIMLAFEYFCPDGVGQLEVFYSRNLARGWSQNRAIEGGSMPRAEAWQPFAVNLDAGSRGQWSTEDRALRLDFGRRPGLHLQLRNVHLRPATEAELRSIDEAEAILQAKRDRAEIIDTYLKRDDWQAQVVSVSVGKDSIEVKGQANNRLPRGAVLIEFEPHEDPWTGEGGAQIASLPRGREFNISVPRFDGNRDRLVNRFAVAVPEGNGYRLLSRAHWADDVSGAAQRDMPRLRPANKKGMAGAAFRGKRGIFEKDLLELGMTSATVNIPLGGMLQPGANRVEYRHQGRTWSFNLNQVRVFDESIKQLTDMNIVVSGIFLVNPQAGILVHPEYDPAGIYSMGNLTTREAADTYRALVSFLAERYSRPDKRYGWVSHWIIFNEIDYGWVWTNMGEQPLSVYMDAYDKAMRVSWLEIRRYNPTAEVFISLTHQWDYRPTDPYRTYPPRALIDRMALYSQVTGDYAWSVAYHPYPESLLRPRTWEDNQSTASFDTAQITAKNIEVLDAYMHQEHLLYQGGVRTVLLSEQGFHTPDYSEQSMLDKAAAIAFTWAKIVPLKSIEAFHYHRWIDHPLEGGLKVGLRTLADDENPYGIRKEPAFSVMAAMETEREAEMTAPLKSVIGIQSWDEVRIPLESIRRD